MSHDTDLLLGGVPLGRADSRDADVDRAAKEGMAMAFKVQVVLGVNTGERGQGPGRTAAPATPSPACG